MASDSPKVKGTPGWNDPPMFTYDSQVQGIQAAKLSLTKRVSFPLASGSTPNSPIPASGGPPLCPPGAIIPPSSSCLPSNLPPAPPLSNLPPVPPTASQLPFNIPVSSSGLPSNPLTDSESSLSDVAFQQIYENLESQIEDMNESNERTASDIKKKIKLLESLWSENKFNLQLKIRILELTKAINDKNVKLGQELQRSLMVDHAALCSSWIPALRQLLNSLESTDELKIKTS